MSVGDNLKSQVAKASQGLGSWYGRINIITIVICIIIGFAGMISISVLPGSVVPYAKDNGNFWFLSRELRNKTGIEFPSFQLDFEGKWPGQTTGVPASSFHSITCKYWGNDVYKIPLTADYSCSGTVKNCANIKTDPKAKAIAYDDDHIFCNVWVNWNGHQYLHWRLADSMIPVHHAGPYDGNAGGVWIPPTNDSRVLVSKSTRQYTSEVKAEVWWSYELETRTKFTDSKPAAPLKTYLFNVAIVMKSLYVDNWVEQRNTVAAVHHIRNGFSKAGEIGGFWFFLIVIRAIFMWLVGLVLGFPREQDGFEGKPLVE